LNKKYINITDITKTYKKSKIPALKNLNLKIEKGKIHGILGPNGAGKTTTISLITGLLIADSGLITIAGLSIPKQLNKLKKIIGLVPQNIALYQTLTAKENLQYFGALYNIKKSERNLIIDKLLKQIGLYDRRNDKIENYSGGMKRRINFIVALLNKPEILILDEATTGIDVQSKQLIFDFLLELNKNGTTVIYTSHLMDEAEKNCDNIFILDKGCKIEEGTPKELIAKYKNTNSLEEVYIELTGKEIRN